MPKKQEIEVKGKKKNKVNDMVKGKAVEKKEFANFKNKNDKIKKVKNKRLSSNTKNNKINNTTKLENKKNKIINNKNLEKNENFLNEYYDLPYRYNETIVTILAQTPKRLFVYWDISDKDKEAYRKAFGDDFFEKTYPVLLVHNEELNYTFEVPINDFANSWYLDIKDSKTNYIVQLGRKFRDLNQAKKVDLNIVKEEKIKLQNDFIYITDSNKLEAPNDHILFELLSKQVTYRNVKNGNEFSKDLNTLTKSLKNVYSKNVVHELYTKLYSDEIEKVEFGMKNPSSNEFGLPSSSSNVRSSGQW